MSCRPDLEPWGDVAARTRAVVAVIGLGSRGGGGSFDGGIDQILMADIRTRNGGLIITELAPVPSPGSIALLSVGLASLTAISQRRR
jgi:hypothetical protein